MSHSCRHLGPQTVILSCVEQGIIRETCTGESLKVCAYRLGITEGALRVRLHRIYPKLGFSGRGARRELARWAASNVALLRPAA